MPLDQKVGCQKSIHTKVLELRGGIQLLQIDIPNMFMKQHIIPKALLTWLH